VQATPFVCHLRNDSFDVVTVGYGLRNLADIERGLLEIYRVLRPGGKLLSLDFRQAGEHRAAPDVFRASAFSLAADGPVVVRRSGRLCLHSRVARSLSGATRHQGTDGTMWIPECGFEEFLAGQWPSTSASSRVDLPADFRDGWAGFGGQIAQARAIETAPA